MTGPDPLAEARFWAQILASNRRTIICPPDDAGPLRARIAERGLADEITVRGSAACPAGQIILADETAALEQLAAELATTEGTTTDG